MTTRTLAPKLAPDDLACARCSYSLYAQPFDAGCPECGYSVHASSLDQKNILARTLTQSTRLLSLGIACALRDSLMILILLIFEKQSLCAVGVILAFVDLVMVIPFLYRLCARTNRRTPQDALETHWLGLGLWAGMIFLCLATGLSLLLIPVLPAVPLVLLAATLVVRAAVWVVAIQGVRLHTQEQGQRLAVEYLRASQWITGLSPLLYGPLAYWGFFQAAWSDEILQYYCAGMLAISAAASALIVAGTIKPILATGTKS